MSNFFIAGKALRKSALLRACVLSAVSFAALNSYAATATSNMSVTASIAANCTISAGALAFGVYDPVSTNATVDLDQTATLSTTCTTGSTPTITLGQGANAGTGSTATAPIRQLASGTDRLAYQLYSDSARTTVWSDTGVATPTASGTAQTNTVYGRISSGQNKPVGSYTDTVVATVTF